MLSAAWLILLAGAASLSAAEDRVLADFEASDYAGWTVRLEAFGAGPLRPGGESADGGVTGFRGRGLAASAASDREVSRRGMLESPEFTIDRDYINVLIGGGERAFRAAVSLIIDGRVVRTSSGRGGRELHPSTWDVRPWRGQRAWIGLYDHCIEDEDGFVLVDEIVLSDTPETEPGGGIAPALAKVRRQAVAAIQRNAAAAAADPHRPVYHYAPPAQRMNDPNGPAWHNGYHHVFYQHMVFEGSGPAIDVHWGHARSRDLVHWETLPLAIAPEYDRGEHSCFSGNLAWDANGDPVQFVTMVPYLRDGIRQIWPARPLDGDWIRWERVAVLPPVGLVPREGARRNLKDAFPFTVGDRRFLVLTDTDIPIYEALNPELAAWTFRGVLDRESAECPNFFEVDGHWVYLASPHEPVRYRIGTFDAEAARFVPRTEGRLNHDAGFYASTAYRDDRGRTLLLGVSRGQKSSEAWTGVLAMPRVLSIGADGHPRMHPVAELAALRREPFRLEAPVTLDRRSEVIAGLGGDTLEIRARFRIADASAVGLRVRRSADGRRSLPVLWRDGEIVVARETPRFPIRYPLDLATREIEFRVFLDKGMLDTCTADGRVFESRVHQAPLADLGVEAFAAGGTAQLLELEAWQMAPATIDHAALFRE